MGRDVSSHGSSHSNGRPIFSVYPNASPSIRSLLHGVISPRILSNQQPAVFIMWSRDGNLDARRGAWFQLNHFIPLLEESPTLKKAVGLNEHHSTVQGKITSFFSHTQNKKRKLSQECKHVVCDSIKSGTNIDTPRMDHKSEATKGRRVTCATVEKWKREDLAIHEADTWLDYGVDKSDQGKFCSRLKCTVCIVFEQAIKQRRNFSRSWIGL